MIKDPIGHWPGSDILIVDDSLSNLRLLSEILNVEGYSVRTATGGELALQRINEKMPSIILLDVLMPGMDGFEVCRRLKADEYTCDIPVIFISSLEDKHYMLSGFDLGGVDFISKPFRKEEVLARVKTHIRLFQLQADLKAKNEKLEDEIIKRKQAELVIEERIIALTQPLDDSKAIDFNELFNIVQLQQLQDQFADAFGVASIITHPDGTPITKPSQFSHLCQNIIRCTEKGRLNCMHSDAVIGRHNPEGPLVQTCLSGGLWDAGASITVGGNHVANWLIGQVRSEVQKEGKMEEYAREIGADETDFMKAFHEIPSMSLVQFQKISEVLFTLAGQLSDMAYQNALQAHFINGRKQAETALLESEERFRTTLYSIGDGVITTDNEGRIRLMNPLAEQLTGWNQHEAEGKTLEEVFKIINEDNKENVEIPVRKVLREGLVVGLANHTLLISKDGKEIPIADSGAPIRNENGDVVGVVLVFRDQTDDREAERALIESKNQLELSLKVNKASVFENNFETGKVTATPELYQFLGYEPHEIPGILDDIFKLVHPDDVLVVKNAVADHFSGKTDEYFAEFRIKTKLGEWRWIDGRGKVVKRNEKGDPVLLLGISRDIHTRKLTEEALRNSEFFFRESQRAANIGSYKYDLVTGFWDSSEILDQIFGIDKEYIRSVEGWKDLIYQDDLEMMDHHLKEEVIAQRNQFNKEYRIIRKSDGEIRWVNGLGQLNFDADGNILSLIGTIRDITTRKITDEILKENEEKFRNIFEHSPIGKSMTGIDGSLNVNHAFCEMLGYTELELKEKKWEDISHPDDYLRSNELVQDLLEGKITDARFEKRYFHKNGNVIWTDVSTFLQRDSGGKPKYFITSINNITQRKEAEENLRRNEQKFRALIENSSDAISLVDSSGFVIYDSPSYQRMMGYSDEKRKGKNTLDLVHPDDRDGLINLFAEITQSPGISGLSPIRVRHADGSWLWIEGIANNLLADPDIQAIVINFRDITQRKQSEDLLVESEEKFRKLADSTPISICVYQDENWVYTNRAGEKLSGYTFNEFCHLKIWEFVTPEYRELVKESVKARLEGHGSTEGYELKILTKSGVEKWVYLKGSLISYLGKPAGLISVLDITQRKESEWLLKESEERYRSMFNMSLAVMLLIDTETGRIVDANEAAVQFYGWSYDELISMDISKINTLSPLELKIEMKKAIVNSRNYFLFKHRNAEGKVRDVEVYSNRISVQGKELLLSIIHDVSEKIQIEDQLRLSERQYRSLFEQAADGIFIADSQGNYVDVNLYGCAMLGYSREEILKLNIKDVVERKEEASNPIKYKEMRTEHLATAERQLVCKNGDLLPVEISGKMLDDGRFQGIVRDISERRQAEKAILDANQKMNSFFEQSLDGFFFMMLDKPIEWNETFDKEQLLEYSFLGLKISRVNDAMLAQYGAELSQILGKRFSDFFAHDLEQGKKVLHKIFDKGKLQIETEERKLNGDTMFVEGDYTCLYDSEGKITGLFGIQRDITESKRNLETIRNERTLLRTLIDNLPDPIYVKDNKGRKMVANQADIENIGVSTEAEVLGKSDLELFNTEVGYRGYEDDLIVIKSGKPVINREEIFYDKNGIKRLLLTSKIPLFDQNGKVTSLVGIGRDITEQKRANETIQKLTKSIEQSPSTIVITDIHGTIEYVNPKFSEITGYSMEEAIGQNPRILKSGEMPVEVYMQLWETISSGNVWRGEFLNRKKNGALYWEWATMTSIKNELGVITNYIAIKEDISLRKQMEADLIVAKDKAEESDRLKSAFLANMSHEIRTPLNSIIGFSELLADSDFEEDQKDEFIHHIIDNGNNLLNIISDIIDISKIESGEITIRNSKVMVKKFLDEIIDQNKFKIERNHLECRNVCLCMDSGAEISVLADKERLKQVMNNLISNALKFTSEGFIEVGCKSMGKWVEFYVKDSGIGVSPEFHDIIFGRFRQVEASYNRKFGGNGLGLAISKNLIELMEGKMWIESELGKGATFYFTLPKVY